MMMMMMMIMGWLSWFGSFLFHSIIIDIEFNLNWRLSSCPTISCSKKLTNKFRIITNIRWQKSKKKARTMAGERKSIRPSGFDSKMKSREKQAYKSVYCIRSRLLLSLRFSKGKHLDWRQKSNHWMTDQPPKSIISHWGLREKKSVEHCCCWNSINLDSNLFRFGSDLNDLIDISLGVGLGVYHSNQIKKKQINKRCRRFWSVRFSSRWICFDCGEKFR